MLRSLAEPLAEADIQKALQETAQEKEVTRRAEIEAGITGKVIVLAGVLLVGVLLIGAMALLLGKESLTEKLLIALVSFLGGYGFARRNAEKK